MANNTAIVGVLSDVRAIEGADKIKQATVKVNGVTQANVVVGVDTAEGTLTVYFTSNMCLTDTILQDHKDLGRYLGKAGRVRTVKLRGVISDGLCVSPELLQGYDDGFVFSEGVEFTCLGKYEICHRYAPPIKLPTQPKGKQGKKPKTFSKLVDGQLALHYDTDNLRRNAHRLALTDIVSVTRKIHGTSFGVAHVLTKKPLNWFESILKKFNLPVKEMEYDYLYHSRSVVKNATISLEAKQGYYGTDLWSEMGETYFKGKLHEGESVYGEIVGFLTSGSAIQKGYPYGCKPGEYKVYIYRITMTTPQGVKLEYGWEQLKERCKELNIPHVEEYFYGRLGDLVDDQANYVEVLEKKFLGKRAIDCNGKPDEGIVIRKDHVYGAEAFKLKDPAFILGESEAFEKGDEDMEEGA